MKKLILSLSLILGLSVLTSGQSISSPCVLPATGNAVVAFSATGDINIRPCEEKVLSLIDSTYVPAVGTYAPVTLGFLRKTLEPNRGFTGFDIGLPLTITKGNNQVSGTSVHLDVTGGEGQVGGTLVGQRVSIYSNGLTQEGMEAVGVDSTVDIGTPFTNTYGGRFTAYSGGSGATGLGNIFGVQGVVATGYNGANPAEAYGGDFHVYGVHSTFGQGPKVSAVRGRVSVLGAGQNLSEAIGVNVGNWVKTSGNVTLSAGIRIDNSIDIGTFKYAIYSTSTSKSLFHGNVILGLGSGLTITTPKTPASSSATCSTGEHAWDTNYYYICTGVNTWKRTTLATW